MRRGRRTTIGAQFAPRRIDMLRSPAYCALSLSARRVLDRLEIELADHGGTDTASSPSPMTTSRGTAFTVRPYFLQFAKPSRSGSLRSPRRALPEPPSFVSPTSLG